MRVTMPTSVGLLSSLRNNLYETCEHHMSDADKLVGERITSR